MKNNMMSNEIGDYQIKGNEDMPKLDKKGKTFRVASFFSGIGGFDLGFEKTGMTVVFQNEIDNFCRKILRKHWPNVQLEGDINLLSSEDIPDAELWCGGFPCQDLSLANQGKRKGLRGDRSGLFYKFADLLGQGLPKWVVIENVPGLLNSNKGEDFKILLKTLDEFGYGVAWRIFDAKYFGTPQRRRRVFIIGSYRSIRSFEVLFGTEASGISVEKGRVSKEAPPRRLTEGNKKTNIYSIQHAGVGRKPSAGPQAKGYRNDGETYTFDSRGSSDVVCSPYDAFRIRKTSGVSRNMDSTRYRALGNAVNVNIVEWIGKRILAVEDNTH